MEECREVPEQVESKLLICGSELRQASSVVRKTVAKEEEIVAEEQEMVANLLILVHVVANPWPAAMYLASSNVKLLRM
jgi:hypothetical protein